MALTSQKGLGHMLFPTRNAHCWSSLLDSKKKSGEYTKHSENPTAQLSSPSFSRPRFARGAVQQALIFTVLDLLRSEISELPVDLLGSETGSHLFCGTEGQNATWHATESTALLRHLFLHGPMESMGGEIHRLWKDCLFIFPGLSQDPRTVAKLVSTFPRPVKMLKKCHCLALTVARLQGLL
jgi:hypothetical protein